jgi:hypothetical protein
MEGGVINSFRHLIIKKILPSPRRRGVGGEVKTQCEFNFETALLKKRVRTEL